MNEHINNTQLNVAAIQMNSQQSIEDNLSDIKSAIMDARAQGAQLVVLQKTAVAWVDSLLLQSALMRCQRR